MGYPSGGGWHAACVNLTAVNLAQGEEVGWGLGGVGYWNSNYTVWAIHWVKYSDARNAR